MIAWFSNGIIAHLILTGLFAMKKWFFMVLLAFVVSASAQSPYAGEQQRAIKALSDDQIGSLHAGRGMGLAEAAELNGYPGPKHVLELRDELALTDVQVTSTEQLFNVMQTDAQRIGKNIVAAEQRLDALFATGEATTDKMQVILFEIGELQARLRGIHLGAHITQKSLLTESQVHQYMTLRGYQNGEHHQHHHH